MTTPVKTFTTKVTDEYGGEYPQAVVAIRAWSKSSQETGESMDCKENYQVETKLEAIAYKANYWYTNKTKSEGRRSRPLKSDDDNSFVDVFEVDIEHPDVIQVFDSALTQEDKTLRVIKMDLIRRFA